MKNKVTQNRGLGKRRGRKEQHIQRADTERKIFEKKENSATS